MDISNKPKKKEVPLPRIKVECFNHEKLYATHHIPLDKKLKLISKLIGEGVSNKTIIDLKRTGFSETEMDSGRSFKYTVEK